MVDTGIHHISRSFLFSEFYCFLLFYDFTWISLTWNHMGVKISNDISSESTHQIHTQKILHTHRESLYESCSKNCESSNFDFAIFFVLVFINMGPCGGNSFKRHLL